MDWTSLTTRRKQYGYIFIYKAILGNLQPILVFDSVLALVVLSYAPPSLCSSYNIIICKKT